MKSLHWSEANILLPNSDNTNYKPCWTLLQQEIRRKIAFLSRHLMAENSSILKVLKHDFILPNQQKLSSHVQTISDWEYACKEGSDQWNTLDAMGTTLKVQVKQLAGKYEDLEGTVRTSNLRLVGLPKGLNGHTRLNFCCPPAEKLSLPGWSSPALLHSFCSEVKTEGG